jgi:hypothetical protein
MKGKIVLIQFPFDDLSASKVRPAYCLTQPIGNYQHIIFALITSRILCVGTWGDFAEPIHALKDYGDREPAGQIPLPKVVMAIQKSVILNSVLGQKIKLAIVLEI